MNLLRARSTSEVCERCREPWTSSTAPRPRRQQDYGAGLPPQAGGGPPIEVKLSMITVLSCYALQHIRKRERDIILIVCVIETVAGCPLLLGTNIRSPRKIFGALVSVREAVLIPLQEGQRCPRKDLHWYSQIALRRPERRPRARFSPCATAGH